MPQDAKLVKNAQTLQQAKPSRSPADMAKLLGVAGDGVAEFYRYLFESQKPEDLTDVGTELAPLGLAAKGVASAIGMIPPKFITPMVKALRERVLPKAYAAGGNAAGDVVDQFISQNPRSAAHLRDINVTDRIPDFNTGLPDPNVYGQYTIMDQGIKGMDPSTRGWGNWLTDMIDDPSQNVFGKIDIATVPHQLTGESFRPTVRHEGGHLVQDIYNGEDLNLMRLENHQMPYQARPFEIGARVTEQKAHLEDEWGPNFRQVLKEKFGPEQAKRMLSPVEGWNRELLYLANDPNTDPKALRRAMDFVNYVSPRPVTHVPGRKFTGKSGKEYDQPYIMQHMRKILMDK